MESDLDLLLTKASELLSKIEELTGWVDEENEECTY